MVRPEVLDEAVPEVQKLGQGNLSRILQEKFTIRSATSDHQPVFFCCVFASSQTQLTERDGEVYTEHTSWNVSQHTFCRKHTLTDFSLRGDIEYQYGYGYGKYSPGEHYVILSDAMVLVPLGSFLESMRCGAHGDNLTISAYINRRRTLLSCSWNE